MLVLSRKKNESIIINDNITVTVIEIRGDKVRLGIEAPKHITVHRDKVWLAIQEENRRKAPEGGPDQSPAQAAGTPRGLKRFDPQRRREPGKS